MSQRKFKIPNCPICGGKMHRIITRKTQDYPRNKKIKFYSVFIYCPNEENSDFCFAVRGFSSLASKEKAKAQARHFVLSMGDYYKRLGGNINV